MTPTRLGSEPQRAASTAGDLLAGDRLLRHSFLAKPIRSVERGEPVPNAADGAEPQVALIRSGFVYRSYSFADGRRSIIDLLTPSDIAGLDLLVLAHPVGDFFAANQVDHHLLSVAEMRQLMEDRRVALRPYALLAEAHARTTRLAVSIGRLDARARISLLLLDIHDRLRQRKLIRRPIFNLPLTQEQIADHLGLTGVHVNRTLRRLREEGLVIFGREMVAILDLDRLREVVGLFANAADLSLLAPSKVRPAKQR